MTEFLACLIVLVLLRAAVRVSRCPPGTLRVDVHHHVHVVPAPGEREPMATALNVIPFRQRRHG